MLSLQSQVSGYSVGSKAWIGAVSRVSKGKMCCNPSQIGWDLSTEVGFAQKPMKSPVKLRLLQSEVKILIGMNFYPSESW